MKVKIEAVLSLFFVVTAAWALFEARDWPASTRFFPWVIGVPLLVLSLLQLGTNLKGRAEQAGTAMDLQLSEGVEPGVARRRTLNILAWLFGFAAAIWVLGFNVTILLTFFLYLRFQAGEGWALTVTLTAAAYLFFWGLFDRLLRLPLPEPRLWVWFEALIG